jgi:hypothetical protein
VHATLHEHVVVARHRADPYPLPASAAQVVILPMMVKSTSADDLWKACAHMHNSQPDVVRSGGFLFSTGNPRVRHDFPGCVYKVHQHRRFVL